MQRPRVRLLAAAAALLALALLGYVLTLGPSPATPDQAASAHSVSAAPSSPLPTTGGQVTKPPGFKTVKESQLPTEGRRTLSLIRSGGPYPFDRDGVGFGNFEGILPRKPGGYYHEYTVPTPGSSVRGARRIITGDGGEKYYTADHYLSFAFILEGQ